MCHTDLIVRDQYYPVPLPAVLGHEGSGIVESVGNGVSSVQPGTYTINPKTVNTVEEIRKITGKGANYSIETTSRPEVLRQAVDCLATLGTAVVIGAPALHISYSQKSTGLPSKAAPSITPYATMSDPKDKP
ncbi:hypothetical protein EXW96_04105 [Paenibacillus sp. JMULE4]|nr:zinc-binding dehydrogenase [Paenibacillus sp. JMULE4]NTZ16773.1 hypothetical protein [Paenibacillus sp. JMULE4]